MNEQELKNYILHIISQLKSKAQVENNKIELKREWYDFKTPDKRKIIESEFLKDIVSLANTPGLEGYLII